MRFLIRCCVFISVFVVFFSCNMKYEAPVSDDIEPAAMSFFSYDRFEKEVSEGLHYKDPAYCFRLIRETVPQRWWRYGVEGLYYRLPEIKDTGLTERWLDTAQVALPDENVLSFLQMIRGSRLIAKGSYNEAEVCLQASFDLATKQHQPFRASDAKRYMARCYLLKGDYPKASALLLSVYDFLKDKSDIPHEVRKYETMMGLAHIYNSSKDHQQAQYWAQAAYQYAHQYPNHGQEVRASESLAQAFLDQNKPDSAYLVLQVAASIRDTCHVSADSAWGHYLIGRALTEMGQYQKALPLLSLAASSNLETFNRSKIAAISASMADCFLGMGMADTAQSYYLQALSTTPDSSAMGAIHYKLSGIYEEKGAFQAAMVQTKLGNHCYRNFFSAEKDRAIGKLESSIALEREENRVRFLTEQHKIQRFKFAVLLLLFLMSGSVWGYLTERQRRRHVVLEKENKLLEAQKLIQQQKLRLSNVSLKEKERKVSALQHLLDLKNQLITTLEQQQILPEQPDEVITSLRLLTESDWLTFLKAFEKHFPGYFGRMKKVYPQITSNEIRLFLFIKIGLESAEIAAIWGISLESVYRNRTRLRQKLGLDSTANLEHFIRKF